MKNKFLLLAFISIFLSNNKISAQCIEAENYVKEIKEFQDTASPTVYASSGKKVDGLIAYGRWHALRCECENSDSLSDNDLKRLADHLNVVKGEIQANYSKYGNFAKIKNTQYSDCKRNGGNTSTNGIANSSSSTKQQLMKSFANYNKAMGLKNQGVGIAKTFSNQVKNYSQLNKALSPEDLLQNFNQNMKAISELKAQNKTDNLEQIGNTLNSALNDLNSGNHEGALFSTLSLLEQGEAKREANRKVVIYRAILEKENKTQMDEFLEKALTLNRQTIDLYYERAAYAETKSAESTNLAYAEYLECFEIQMYNNFDYYSTYWNKNNCDIPEYQTAKVNPFQNTPPKVTDLALRKYNHFLRTKNIYFYDASIRFAASLAHKKPNADNYYLIGHYAGEQSPLVAYLSFQTVLNFDSDFFKSVKLRTEYEKIVSSLENTYKIAIEEGDTTAISSLIKAGLDNEILIDGQSGFLYSIKVNQPDITQLFLLSFTKGKDQSHIDNQIQKTLVLATINDADKILNRFFEYGIDLKTIQYEQKSLLELSIKYGAVNSFDFFDNKVYPNSDLYQKFSDKDIVQYKKIISLSSNNDIITAYTSISDITIKKKVILHKHYHAKFSNKLVESLCLSNPAIIPYDILDYFALKKNYVFLDQLILKKPNIQIKLPFSIELSKGISDEKNWRIANSEGTKIAYSRYLHNPLNTKYRSNALMKIKNINSIPMLIMTANKKGNYGCYNRNGEVSIPFIYSALIPFSEGLIGATYKGKAGYINTKGETVIPFKYIEVGQFYNGLALATMNGSDYISIDKKGNQVADLGKLVKFFPYTDLVVSKIDGLNVLLNFKGETLCNNDYNYLLPKGDPMKESEIYIGVQNNKTKKFGVLDHNGNLVVKCRYMALGDRWNSGRFGVKKATNGKWGIIDNKDRELTPFVFDELFLINSGRLFTPNQEAYVRIGNQFHYIDSEGKKIEELGLFNLNGFIHNYKYSSCYNIPKIFYQQNDTPQLRQYFTTINPFTKLTLNIKNYSISGGVMVPKNRMPLLYGLNKEGNKIIQNNKWGTEPRKEIVTAVKPNQLLISCLIIEHTKIEVDNHIFYVNIQGELVDYAE